jgi:gamma-butyrobetaine dioxygenase
MNLRMAVTIPRAIRTVQTLSRHVAPFKWRNYAAISNLQLANDNKIVSVEFDGVGKHVYHAVWLKHLCHCLKCKDPSSEQTRLTPESIRGSYKLSSVVNNGESLQVTWEDDEDSDHKGTFPVDWLKDNAYGEDVLDKLSREARPVPLTGKVTEFNYKRLTESPPERLDWLLKVYEEGLSVLTNVPTEHQYVMKVADFIFSVQHSVYGKYFDVISSENPTNIAYTSQALSFHMDQPIYESPPGLQLLHCIKFDDCIEGGENVLVDQLVAAEEFRRDHPEEFDTLANVTVKMGRIHYKRDRPIHMFQHCRHFVLGHNDEIVAVNWSPLMQLGINMPYDMVEPYYHARALWANYLKNFHIRPTVLLRPGYLLIFNNRRILHSRAAFSLKGGERHLQGCYVNINEFKSEVLTQCALQGRALPKARLGNQDFVC